MQILLIERYRILYIENIYFLIYKLDLKHLEIQNNRFISTFVRFVVVVS